MRRAYAELVLADGAPRHRLRGPRRRRLVPACVAPNRPRRGGPRPAAGMAVVGAPHVATCLRTQQRAIATPGGRYESGARTEPLTPRSRAALACVRRATFEWQSRAGSVSCAASSRERSGALPTRSASPSVADRTSTAVEDDAARGSLPHPMSRRRRRAPPRTREEPRRPARNVARRANATSKCRRPPDEVTPPDDQRHPMSRHRPTDRRRRLRRPEEMVAETDIDPSAALGHCEPRHARSVAHDPTRSQVLLRADDTPAPR